MYILLCAQGDGAEGREQDEEAQLLLQRCQAGQVRTVCKPGNPAK